MGPCETQELAIQEALDLGCYDEVETVDGWRRLVHFAECRGLHYDCGECGTDPEACDQCRAYGLEGSCGTFNETRNEGSVLREYNDNS